MHIKVPACSAYSSNQFLLLFPSKAALISSNHWRNVSGIVGPYNPRVEQAFGRHLNHLSFKRRIPPTALGQLFKNPREGETICVRQEVNSCIKRKLLVLSFFIKIIIAFTEHLLCLWYQYMCFTILITIPRGRN